MPEISDANAAAGTLDGARCALNVTACLAKSARAGMPAAGPQGGKRPRSTDANTTSTTVWAGGVCGIVALARLMIGSPNTTRPPREPSVARSSSPTTSPAAGPRSSETGMKLPPSPPEIFRVDSTRGAFSSLTSAISAVPRPAPQNPRPTRSLASAEGRTKQRTTLGARSTIERLGTLSSTTSLTTSCKVGAA